MRKQIAILFVLVMALQCAVATPIDSEHDAGGWSWRDGLLGRSTPDGDIFDSEELYPGILCHICRDPSEHPMDFVAVAYNSYFGEEPWLLGSNLGTPFRIYNLQLQWVVVWFEGIAFDGISLLPNTMTIHVRLQNGQIQTFSVIQGGPDLTVGDPNQALPTGSHRCTCGGEDDSDDADEDYVEPEEERSDEADRTGRVEIVDPDEDGGFPEWDL